VPVLAHLNRLDPARTLFAGSTLRLPAPQYTVQPGDTLSGIAQARYGNASLWPRLFEANRDQIDNPDLIFPGQVLRIPQ
jgi:nucleoid-associated protein YgaU